MTKATEMNAKTSAVMTEITNTVINAIKTGTAPWQKPWQARGGDNYPMNIHTGRLYNGLNAIYLDLLGGMMGSPYWVGFKQARAAGGNVRKGEKATQILRPIMRKYEDEAGKEHCYPVGFAVVNVFNLTQCEGIEAPESDKDDDTLQLDAPMLDKFIANIGSDVRHSISDSAYYSPATDHIQMPEKDQFKSEGGYYGTLLHEHIHWTGHKSRLNRLDDKSKRGYAFEELIAELGAYYAARELGCPNEAENHASYLNSWLKALESDEKYLWQAAGKAERAAKMLIEMGKRESVKAAA